MSKKKKKNSNTLVRNKKAFHNYTILETYETGIELKGTEVKSCRAGNISISEAHVKIFNGEVFLMNANISVYDHGNQFNHEPARQRKLLLHKSEIRKLLFQIREKANAIVPISFYLARGKVKVSIGVGKGKNVSDKRDTMRKKQDDKDAKRAISNAKKGY